MDDADLDPREAARARRRDRDLSAEARDLMRPGMGKVFKQIQDAQRRVADDAEQSDATTPGDTTAARRRGSGRRPKR